VLEHALDDNRQLILGVGSVSSSRVGVGVGGRLLVGVLAVVLLNLLLRDFVLVGFEPKFVPVLSCGDYFVSATKSACQRRDGNAHVFAPAPAPIHSKINSAGLPFSPQRNSVRDSKYLMISQEFLPRSPK
jgi:hypothetical protein